MLIDLDEAKKAMLKQQAIDLRDPALIGISFDGDLACEILDRLPAAADAPQWIPVSERLPEEEDRYLVCFPDGPVLTSMWHEETKYNNGFNRYMTVSCEDNRKTHNIGVIAWMPLPEPYEEGKQ